MPTDLTWRKSTFSGGDSDCVEVAWPGGRVVVRDSKNPGAGHLSFPAEALAGFAVRLLDDVQRRDG